MVGAPELVIPQDRGAVRCLACGHRCHVMPGHEGVCKVRFNRDGEMRVPGGYVAALQIDPIEKKLKIEKQTLINIYMNRQVQAERNAKYTIS